MVALPVSMSDEISNDSEPRPQASDADVANRRIRYARETNAALRRIRTNPSKENIAALHELHETHSRELGDEEAAARADERARHVKASALPEPASGPAPDEPTPADAQRPTSQVQYARRGSERSEAALERAVEGADRAETYEARTSAARERSAAARRRLLAAEARGEASRLRLPLEDGDDARGDERDRVADERERIADERERAADRRDRRADQRDKAAETRERASDERERLVGERQRFLDARRGLSPDQ
jgi:sulfite oxidase